MANETPQRIKIELDQLFPGKTITVGNQAIIIRPLSTLKLATIIKKVNTLINENFKNKGITTDNFNKPENIPILAEIILTQSPDLLAEASNIHVEDLQALPIEIVIEILDKVIEVNLESKEVLMGNFMRLAQRFNLMEKKEKEPLVESSKS